MAVEFDEAKHEYTVDGVVLPSVTHIIRFLNYDIADSAKSWLRDVAADRGRRIHAYCADIDFGAEPELIDWDCIGYVNAYRQFLRDYKPKWSHIEVPFGSVERGYAGTPDRIGAVDNRTVLVDFKSGARLHKAPLAAQLAGYNDLISFLIQDAYGLHLKKDGKYSFTKITCDYKAFDACKLLHERLESA